MKWVSCTAATFTWGSRDQQASAHTYLDPSVPLIFKVARFRAIKPTYLLTVNYGPEIFRGEDTDSVSQRAGAELSIYAAIPGQPLDIKREPQLKCPIKTRVNINRGPAWTIWHCFLEWGLPYFRQPYIYLIGLLNEMPHNFCVGPSWVNKGGHHGCTCK